MAVKDIKEAYEDICNQYHDMIQEIKDFEEEAKKGLIEPERLDQIKESIRPLLINYERWSYIMFLLNKPVRKSKYKAYELRNKKFLKLIEKNNTQEGVLKENEAVLESLKKITEK